MNIGECPYKDCDNVLLLEIPDKTPVYARIKCDECNRTIWYRFSRIDPMGWTEKDFMDEHDICEETKQIEPKLKKEANNGSNMRG